MMLLYFKGTAFELVAKESTKEALIEEENKLFKETSSRFVTNNQNKLVITYTSRKFNTLW